MKQTFNAARVACDTASQNSADTPQLWRLSVIVALSLLGMLLAAPRGAAQSPPTVPHVPAAQTAPPDAHFTVAQGDGVILDHQTARYDFGQVTAPGAQPIAHTFLLRNDTPAPLHLDHLQPSCGCTSAIVGTDDAPVSSSAQTSPSPPASSVVVNPQQEIRVHISVDPSHLSPGNVEKYIWVFVQGQSSPAAVLEMKGTLATGLSFSPTVLDFGTIKAGTHPSLLLTVTQDTRLLPTTTMTHLESTNPDVLVTPAPEAAITPVSLATPAPVVQTRTYQVSLAPRARLGALFSSLMLLVTDASGATTPLNASVPVRGQVLGDLLASPQSVAFGMVNAGQANTQQIMLTAASPTTLQNLRATSASPFVSVHFLPAKKEASGAPPFALLEVSLSPRIAAGTLESQIIVTTQQGQQLQLPLTVYVVRPQSH